jgi:Methyltransferase domain
MAAYYHYFSFGLSSYIERTILRVREAVFQVFMTELRPQPGDRILDVGVSADNHVAANHFEKRYPHTSKICALGIEHLPALISGFPGLTVVQGDARALPFSNGSFDFVYSHAVIEHLGSREQQSKFLAETVRVARKGVLLTTPNRWHPIESHTGLPLLHYLPQAVCRRIYRALGKGMYASEASLNLLSSRQMLRLLGPTRRPVGEAKLQGVRWLGIRSNLILVILKNQGAA